MFRVRVRLRVGFSGLELGLGIRLTVFFSQVKHFDS